MSKDPAFLFYSQDFLVGTMLMSNEQVGMYIRLLCIQHQKGKLSKADMDKVCVVRDEEVYSKFVLDSDGTYYNIRLREEATKRSKFTDSRRRNLSSSSRVDSHMESHMVAHMESRMENENENENEDVNVSVNERPKDTVKLNGTTEEQIRSEFNSDEDYNNYMNLNSLAWSTLRKKPPSSNEKGRLLNIYKEDPSIIVKAIKHVKEKGNPMEYSKVVSATYGI